MSHQLWTSLDDLSADATVAERRRDEFDAGVMRAIQTLRDEYGIDEHGQAHRPLAVTDSPRHGPDREDLRRLLPAVSRRGFLKLTGAAAVFGLAGCWHEPPETLVPYREQPEGTTLGVPRYYSTAIRVDGRCLPAMAKVYDGRPIKLEGNPDDPRGLGRFPLRGQAALLDLYDSDRLREGPKAAGAAVSWADLDAEIGAAFTAEGRVGLLTGPLDGPADLALIERLRAAVGDFRHASYHPYAEDSLRSVRRAVFGAGHDGRLEYRFDRAEAIVTFGSCPIGGGTGSLYDHVGIGANRKLRQAGAHAEMGHLIAFEPVVTQTGSVADVRQKVAYEDLAAVAWAVAWKVAEITKQTAKLPAGIGEDLHSQVINGPVGNHPALAGATHANPVDYAAHRLVESAGKSLVYSGGATLAGPESRAIHEAVCFINFILGNEGRTVTSVPATAVPDTAATRGLLEAAANGELDVLVLWKSDPAYSLPQARSLLSQAVERGVKVVALSERTDASTALATHVVPSDHDLESWGDGQPVAGTFAIQQPVTLPLWNSRSAQQSLLAFAAAGGHDWARVEADASAPRPVARVGRQALYRPAAAGVLPFVDFLRSVWQDGVRAEVGASAPAKTFWTAALGQGLVTTASEPATRAPAAYNGSGVRAPSLGSSAGFSLVLTASRTLGTGVQANNAWLQETPDPISKVTWDNYLAISIGDAKELGIPHSNGVAELTVDGETLRLPVVVQPGQQAKTLELFLGWGQEGPFGEVATDSGLGQRVNAFRLGGGRRWGISVQVAKGEGAYELACTQNHHVMDGRDIVRHENIDQHRLDPDFSKRSHHRLWHVGTGAVNRGLGPLSDEVEPGAEPHHDHGTRREAHNLSLWGQTHVYPGRRWGMNVDLNACDGCGACIVACGAENNVPVVGRDEVRRGREMHWMRIDRYYSTPIHKDKPEGEGVDVDPYDDSNESLVFAQLDPDEMRIHHQPVMCQHCGHAPCEEVCPPMATMHNDEGVNVQVYNRCIGTRFCANNCPYKVRRFNYYEYSKYRIGPKTESPFGRVVRNLVTEGQTSSSEELDEGYWTEPLSLLLNPTVTVRSKGIMEKCNFCLQRTRDIRDAEKRSNRKYDDGDVMATTACAQTCPTGAITFGDINDPFSEVAQEFDASPHAYGLLDTILNTRPAVSYLRQVYNVPATESEKKYLEGGH